MKTKTGHEYPSLLNNFDYKLFKNLNEKKKKNYF